MAEDLQVQEEGRQDVLGRGRPTELCPADLGEEEFDEVTS